ncbi:MAG: sulfatase [Rhodobacteraceae bacterium]|nr:sulfatase [Paracoccaceae bacterium]
MSSTDVQNILFLSIEDLNDWIEPLGGHPDARTPNINRLAKRGMVFENAYAPAPACSPSRTATLFGQNPWQTGVYANNHKWHDFYRPGTRKSLVGRFRDAGFETRGAGKVFHAAPKELDIADWTQFEQRKIGRFKPISKVQKSGKAGRNSDFGPIADGEEQFDDLNTEWMVDQIKPGARGQFWALGLYRPHLPFIVPQVFFDQFDEVVADPPGLGLNRFDAQNTSLLAALPKPGQSLSAQNTAFRNLLQRHGEYKDMLKAYLASIAYADDLLGQVLDRLDETGQWDNTLIVLWSDHGWQLGEKLAFRKFTLWERALRVPLIFSGPGIKPGRCSDPVSLTDIAPTLFARSGLPMPEQFTGRDLSPLLEGQENQSPGYVVSVWGRGFASDSPQIALSVRSRTHRYIFYWDGSEELYDHRNDPYEHKNLIFDPVGVPQAEIDRLRAKHQAALDFELADPV